ncbi:MAG: hypothetical protein WCS77_07655 [Elusimicrobiaceae bacterium]
MKAVKKIFLYLGIFVLVIFAGLFLAKNVIFKWIVIKTVQTATGASAEARGAAIHFFPPSFSISGLTAANPQKPMENLFEFGETGATLNISDIGKKHIRIENAYLRNLKFGTARAKSGALDKKTAAQTAAVRETGLAAFEKLAKMNFTGATAVDTAGLSSTKLASELKQKIAARSAFWENRIKTANYEARVAELEPLYKQLLAENDFVKRAKLAAELSQKAAPLVKEITQDSRAASDDIAQAKTAIAGLKSAAQKDIKGAGGLSGLDPSGIANELLGPHTGAKISRSLAAYRELMSKPRKESEYLFTADKMEITAELKPWGTNPVLLSGTAENISNKPDKYEKPILITLSGEQGGASAGLTASVKHYLPVKEDDFSASVTGLNAKGFTLGNPDSFALTAEKGSAEISASAKITDLAKVRARLSAMAKDTAMYVRGSVADGNAELRTAIEKALSSAKALTAEVTAEGDIKAPALSFSTNLGGVLSGALNNYASIMANKYRAKIESEIMASVAKEQAQLENQLANSEKILAKLGVNSKKISELTKSATGKGTENLLKNIKLPSIKF